MKKYTASHTRGRLMAILCVLVLVDGSDGVEKAAVEPFHNSRADGKEGESAPGGWTAFSTGGRFEHAVDTQVFHGEPSSGRIRGLSRSGRACFGTETGVFRGVPYYRLSFWHRTTRGCRMHGICRIYDAASRPGAQWLHQHNFAIPAQPGGWRECVVDFAMPTELHAKHPRVWATLLLYGDNDGTAWFDDLDFAAGVAPPPKPKSPFGKPITSLMELHLDTVLVEDGQARAVIAAGSRPRDAAQAKRIQQKIEQCSGSVLPVRTDMEPKEALSKTNVIAIGNLATNPFIETLYRRYFTYLDRFYPGKGGHVVRSLHNPYGTQRNVILVGGSDDAGAASAVEVLTKKLTPGKTLKLGWTMDIKLGEGMAPPKPGRPVLSWSSQGGIGRAYGWNPINMALALYYMTGDTVYLDDFRHLIWPKGKPDARMFNGDKIFGDLKHPLSTGYHYYAHLTPLIWDLVEESPVFTDQERLYMANELLRDQEHLSSGACERFARNGVLPDRHAIHEMLCVWTGTRYFARSYPSRFWDERLAMAARGFDLSLATPASSTPRIQTGSVLWPVPEFALLSGADEYFKPAGVHARRMQKWLCLGEEVVGYHWQYALLHATAHTLKDGRFRNVRPMKQDDWRTFRIGQSYLSGVAPQGVSGVDGLRAFKMWEPNWRRLGMNMPLDEAIEFVCYRAPLGQEKEHLVLYGYYEMSKSPPRTNAILSYQSGNTKVLRRATNNAVTVRKDGMREGAPSNGAALKSLEEIGPIAYTRTGVPDHDFSRWSRSIFLLKGRCLVVFDRITAREEGKYEVHQQWHPTASPKAENNGARWSSGLSECVILTAEQVSVETRTGAVSFVYRGKIGKGQDCRLRSLLAVGA
ncbi:hypothetical protein H8D79_00655, partial [PVC group bacterium]|nr:hypothetical protein [PVC group bacterium]